MRRFTNKAECWSSEQRKMTRTTYGCRVSLSIFAIGAVLLVATTASGINFSYNAASGNWDTDANWSPVGEPATTDQAFIGNNSNNAVTLDATGVATKVTNRMFLGRNGFTGSLDITTGGVLDMTGEANGDIGVGQNGSTSVGNLDITGGSLLARAIIVGANSATGTVTVTSGLLDLATGGNWTMNVGQGGTGNFDLQGGTVNIANTLTFGSTAGTGATGTMSGGALNVAHMNVGFATPGTLTQTGGVTTNSGSLSVGRSDGTTGTYNLTSGTLTRGGNNFNPNAMSIGGTPNLNTGGGAGIWNLGDASGTATVSEQGLHTYETVLIVRPDSDSSGTIQGWADVNFTEILVNNGRIIADGYGTDRDLDLSSFTAEPQAASFGHGTDAVNNSIENTTNNGWFAQNNGRLVLPDVSVSAATFANWGEQDDDVTIDLVNSVQLTFDTAQTGTFALSLLDSAHGSAPAGSPEGSIWQIDNDFSEFTNDTFDLTVRFDDSLYDDNHNLLTLTRFDTGSNNWVVMDTSINMSDNLLITTGITSARWAATSHFAITQVPEPSTAVMMLCALVAQVGFRRKLKRRVERE